MTQSLVEPEFTHTLTAEHKTEDSFISRRSLLGSIVFWEHNVEYRFIFIAVIGRANYSRWASGAGCPNPWTTRTFFLFFFSIFEPSKMGMLPILDPIQNLDTPY